MIELELGTQSWVDSWSEETNPPSEDVSFYLARLNSALRRIRVPLSPSLGRPLTLYSSLWTILALHFLVIHAYT